jgi:acyl dehydratase
MPFDFSVVGRPTEPCPISWDADRTMLYAIGVGAGFDDPLDELEFTTENTRDVPPAVLPTFPVVLPFGTRRPVFGKVDLTRLVAALVSVELPGPFPNAGHGFVTHSVTGIYDKGSGALVTNQSVISDAEGTELARLGGGSFIRGEGGFGGDRGPATDWQEPDRSADAEISHRTMPWQALLYRLSGDHNPLHSDPSFAAAGGFSRPILHGLCTFGFAGRAVLRAAAGSDPARIRSIGARFSAPVLPGDTLTTAIWVDGLDVRFTTRNTEGVVVLSQGRAVLTAAAR